MWVYPIDYENSKIIPNKEEFYHANIKEKILFI